MITINLPKSINIANEILVPGIGNDGLNGGPRGDLILRVTLKSNPFYSKNNHDLHIELEVSYLTALLGGEIVVPSFDGDLKVKISALTKNQSQLRIAKKGFYLSPKSNRRGDLIVTIGIAIPNRILSQSKKHLTAVAQTDPVAIDLNRYHNQQ